MANKTTWLQKFFVPAKQQSKNWYYEIVAKIQEYV